MALLLRPLGNSVPVHLELPRSSSAEAWLEDPESEEELMLLAHLSRAVVVRSWQLLEQDIP